MTHIGGLLADTSSLLRVNLDRFDGDHLDADDAKVILSLVLFRDVFLDGPSVERNMRQLSWTLDIDDGVQIVDLSQEEVRSLYRRGTDLAKHIVPSAESSEFASGHAEPRLVAEITQRHWRPSTYWSHLEHLIPDELREMKSTLDAAYGSPSPFAANTFVALARLFYYLALQEQVGSALLLDPLKSYTQQNQATETAERLMGMFDGKVTTAFEERRVRWLGRRETRFSAPLLSRYVVNKSRERGWSLGRTISWLRESAEVAQFRKGLDELLGYQEVGDNDAVDEVLVMLDSAAETWAARLGAPVERNSLKVTVALPFVEPEFNVALPRLRRRATGATNPATVIVVLMTSSGSREAGPPLGPRRDAASASSPR